MCSKTGECVGDSVVGASEGDDGAVVGIKVVGLWDEGERTGKDVGCGEGAANGAWLGCKVALRAAESLCWHAPSPSKLLKLAKALPPDFGKFGISHAAHGRSSQSTEEDPMHGGSRVATSASTLAETAQVKSADESVACAGPINTASSINTSRQDPAAR